MGFVEKGSPQVFQLSFTIQPGFLLLLPLGTHTDKRQIKIGKQTSPREGPPTPTRTHRGFEKSQKAGWGFLLAHKVTERLRKVSDLCKVSLPFGGGAGMRENPGCLTPNTLCPPLLCIHRIWDLVWEWLQFPDPAQGSWRSLVTSREPGKVSFSRGPILQIPRGL